jgi:hypothetical protein
MARPDFSVNLIFGSGFCLLVAAEIKSFHRKVRKVIPQRAQNQTSGPIAEFAKSTCPEAL